MDAYRQSLPQLALWGPTNFSPIINHVSRFAAQATQQRNASVSLLMYLPLDSISFLVHCSCSNPLGGNAALLFTG